jgi:hypothetical protein
MTLAAREALMAADVVIGYQTYIEQVRPLLAPQQEIIARPMQSELERAQQAIDLADEHGYSFDPPTQAVVERIIHSTADFEFADLVRLSPGAIEAGVSALRGGCAVLTDVHMVRVGISTQRRCARLDALPTRPRLRLAEAPPTSSRPCALPSQRCPPLLPRSGCPRPS